MRPKECLLVLVTHSMGTTHIWNVQVQLWGTSKQQLSEGWGKLRVETLYCLTLRTTLLGRRSEVNKLYLL
jgi:hypothetical protein